MSQNEEQLKSFTEYCVDHPTERFWQALKNWSEYTFIYASTNNTSEENDAATKLGLEDTFYK